MLFNYYNKLKEFTRDVAFQTQLETRAVYLIFRTQVRLPLLLSLDFLSDVSHNKLKLD